MDYGQQSNFNNNLNNNNFNIINNNSYINTNNLNSINMINNNNFILNASNSTITTDEFLAMVGFDGTNMSSTAHQITSSGSSLSTVISSTASNDTTIFSGNNTTIFQGTYPSGYTITHIVIASVIVTILMIIIVVGNMLVIIAIATEKSLKNIQNWFIASLAVADFFLGLVIMPFSLANELMGYWIFGSWWCDIHSAMDVLLCTASIMNLCLISLDRYWSITKAVEYLKSRTPARAALMIAAVWIMSGLICIPPLLGWKAKRPEGQLPQCQLSEDLGYVVYSALGSFYIPSCIMVFVYIRIYFAAKARARRGIKKQTRKPPSEQVTSFSTNKGGTHPMPSVPSTSAQQQYQKQMNQQSHNQHQQIATIETPPTTGSNMPIPIVTCDLASDISTSEAADVEPQSAPPTSNNKETLKVGMMASQGGLVASHNQNSTGPRSPLHHQHNTTTTSSAANGTSSSPNELQVSPLPARCRALSVGIDNDMPIFGRKNHRRNESKAAKHNSKPSAEPSSELEPAIPKVQKQRDPEKEKRRIARKKEKRATLILGLIMGSFIACWLPFFFLYILTPACEKCKIPDSAFAVAFWLGYMNSALNPAIYTIFNKDFRRAFRRILFK